MSSTVIKWHGGKHYLASHIVEIMPEHKRYLEAFGGGMSVLLRKPCEGISEYVNDLHGSLINFWRVLKDEQQFKSFRRKIEATPFSEEVFEKNATFPLQKIGEVDWAVNFFIRNRMSRQGLSRDYATPTKRVRRGMNESCSAWLTAVEGLPAVHKRLQRVEIWHRRATDAIKRLDSPDLLCYADPPYVHDTRVTTGEYEHEMTNSEHLEVLMVLDEMKGNFILSGYHCPLYDHFAENANWFCKEIERPNAASAKKTKDMKTECLWTNFPV